MPKNTQLYINLSIVFQSANSPQLGQGSDSEIRGPCFPIQHPTMHINYRMLNFNFILKKLSNFLTLQGDCKLRRRGKKLTKAARVSDKVDVNYPADAAGLIESFVGRDDVGVTEQRDRQFGGNSVERAVRQGSRSQCGVVSDVQHLLKHYMQCTLRITRLLHVLALNT